MEGPSPRVRALLRQAQRTEESGKRAAAEQLYRQIVEEEPQSGDAWLGLARVSADEATRADALQRVLALDPGNSAAKELAQGVDGVSERNDRAGFPQNELETPVADDPFSQSRSWLDEATARRPDGAREAPSVNEPRTEAPVPARERTAATPQPVTEDAEEGSDEETVLYCYRHPQRETGLRCITCNRPICTKCARHTPVGYRCPQCIREAQDVFYTANAFDYVVTGVVTLILAIIAGLIAPRLGFFVIFIGPAAGTLIGRIAFRVARRRHGRYLAQLVGALVAIGGLLLPVLAMLGGGFSLFALLWPLVYVFLATGAAYYQVK